LSLFILNFLKIRAKYEEIKSKWILRQAIKRGQQLGKCQDQQVQTCLFGRDDTIKRDQPLRHVNELEKVVTVQTLANNTNYKGPY